MKVSIGLDDFSIQNDANTKAIFYKSTNHYYFPDLKMGLRSSKPMNILVVEDNNDFRELLCEMLRMMGHSVTNSASAEEALVAMSEINPDLVITDLTLPGMSGVDLARHIHAAQPEIKIILSSGYGLPAGAQLDFKVGILSKPYSFNQLSNALG